MRNAFTMFTLVFLTTQCEAETFKVDTMGLGAVSCAGWLSTPASEIQGRSWILGFWAGSNWVALTYGAKENVGHSTDGPGIIGEVKKRCLNSPSENLEGVIIDVFNDFMKAGK